MKFQPSIHLLADCQCQLCSKGHLLTINSRPTGSARLLCGVADALDRGSVSELLSCNVQHLLAFNYTGIPTDDVQRTQ